MSDRIAEDIARIDHELAELEREKAGLPPVPTWEQLQEAGAVQELQAREARRGVLPHLIKATRVKRLELQRRKYEDQIAELDEQRTEGYERLEAAREARSKAAEAENEAYSTWYDAHWRIQSYEGHIREINGQISNIKGEC
jgi:hypothetical protein